MNKDILNQLPAEEQNAASKLFSAADTLKVSPTFRWDLETQLMEKYKTKRQTARGWYTKFTMNMGWAFLAVGAVFLLSWMIRSLVPNISPASNTTTTPVISFEADVRAGNRCQGPLAVAHNYSVALTNQDKTGIITLDEREAIGELRSLAWSPDGKQLAIVGNTTGNGNIYLTDSTGSPLQPVLSNSELGYLMDVAWSRDGKQLLTWSLQNNTIVYVMNIDGTGLAEIQLGIQLFATPQFMPNNESIIFYGADSSSSGLFEVRLDDVQTQMISAMVEDESGFAVSPDGTRLAYYEMDRNLGEARLIIEEFATGNKTVQATASIPKGSGSSLPTSANLSWSRNGIFLTFELGRGASDRFVYLVSTDRPGPIKVADSAHTPAFSTNGDCLAYISNKQVFLLDLTSTNATPMFLADLPTGRSITDFQLDKLGWGSGTNPAPTQP